MRKEILGIVTVLMVIFANMYLTLSDNTFDRLLILNNVESLADPENPNHPQNNNGKELRSFYCESGAEYYVCMTGFPDDHCNYEDETYCGVGDTPSDDVTTPGLVNDKCKYYGHIFVDTFCFRECLRCGLTIGLCED